MGFRLYSKWIMMVVAVGSMVAASGAGLKWS
jgi:hypothetical protein